MAERVVTDSLGRVYTAEDFARTSAATTLSTDGFVRCLKDIFEIYDYERLHELMEIRHAEPKLWAEGESLGEG